MCCGDSNIDQAAHSGDDSSGVESDHASDNDVPLSSITVAHGGAK